MLRMSRSALYLSLTAGLLAAPLGCKKGDKPAQNATPQAAFDAAKAALDKKDYQAFCTNLTPESRDAMAGGMVVAGVMMEQFAGLAAAFGGGGDAKEAEEKLAPIREALKKHGVDKEAVQNNMQELQGQASTDPKAVAKLAEPIKDKNAFIADMMSAFEKMGDGEQDETPLSGDAKLVDVKEDGDTASATIVMTKDGAETKEPISFKKIDGTWLIEMPMESQQGDPPASSDL